MSEPHAGAFRRAILALAGGSCDDRIVHLAAELGRPAHAELVGVHVVEIDWTMPLDADIAADPRRPSAILDMAEKTAEHDEVRLEPVLLQARDVGAATRRRGDRAQRRPARPRPAVPEALRRRLRDRADHPVCPQERALPVWVVREPIAEE